MKKTVQNKSIEAARWLAGRRDFFVAGGLLAAALTTVWLVGSVEGQQSPQGSPAKSERPEDLGGPIQGLTEDERRKFFEFKALFAKKFSPEEGLGPVFNAQSCLECHKSPTSGGGSGTAFASLGCMRIGKLSEKSMFRKMKRDQVLAGVYGVDVDPLVELGGPVVARNSISQRFPKYAELKFAAGKVPKEAEFLSIRQATQLYGLGLVLGVPDATLLQIRQDQKKILGVQNAGRQASLPRHFTLDTQYGRFGWKGQHNSLLSFSVEAMNFEMGLTTPFDPRAKTCTGMGNLSVHQQECLPPEPNDKGGSIALKLAYYLALLAPPPRKTDLTPDEKAGQQIFEKAGCAVCHVPSLKTAPKVLIPDPNGTIPDAPVWEKKYGQFWYLRPELRVKFTEVKALENRTIYPYSDFLVHKMGVPLADGLPQGAAGGDYWRTTPLWGLRTRTHYLHDGRTTDLATAIKAHAGQGEPSVKNFNKLSPGDKDKLLKFLRTL